MRSIEIFAVVAGLLSTCAEAIVLQRRTDAPTRVLELAIQRRLVSDPLSSDRLRRRAKALQVPLYNEQTLYFANVSIGTPTQALRLQIDTGSSDLWVNTPHSKQCRGADDPCSDSGTYTANSSSTYSYISSGFKIEYADGSDASGDYVSDNVAIGGATMKGLQFGIGYTSTSSNSVLGVGYQIDEAEVDDSEEKTYSNLPARMVADGLISSNAYSLYLNDLDASTGTVLFGGVDTDRYEGTLATLPINPEDGAYSTLSITLTAVSIAGTTVAGNQKVSALLDSGTSLTYLPNAMASAIYQAIDAQYDSQQGTALVPCSLAQKTSTVEFTFTSPTISVSMSELVIDASDDDGGDFPKLADGSKACIFGIAPADDGDVLLGDSFLRSAYVVYDLANNKISIAQTKFNITTSNILEIGTGANAVPSATPVANPVIASAASGRMVRPTSTSTAAAAPLETAAPLGAVAAVAAAVLFGII